MRCMYGKLFVPKGHANCYAWNVTLFQHHVVQWASWVFWFLKVNGKYAPMETLLSVFFRGSYYLAHLY